MSMPYSSAPSVKTRNSCPAASAWLTRWTSRRCTAEVIDWMSAATLASKNWLGVPTVCCLISALMSQRAMRRAVFTVQCRYVDDQCDAAVAQDGRGGNAVHLAVIRFQVLHHYLLLADKFIDQHGKAASFRLDDRDDSLRGFRARIDHFEDLMQRDQRQIFAANAYYALAPGDRVDIVGNGLQRLHDEVQRQDENLAAHLHRHAIQNRQRQRQHDLRGGAAAFA